MEPEHEVLPPQIWNLVKIHFLKKGSKNGRLEIPKGHFGDHGDIPIEKRLWLLDALMHSHNLGLY